MRPSALAALVVLFLNDHWLKGAHILPGWLTGKLSDAAGLYLFPIVLFVLFERLNGAARRLLSRRALGFGVAGLTALLFALAKVVPSVNQLMVRAWGPMALDPSDLLMLPFAALAPRTMLDRPSAGKSPRVVRLATLASALLVCAATSPPPPRCYPMWGVAEPAAVKLGCAWVEIWVSKSGKEGLGVTVAFLPVDREASCSVAIRAAAFLSPGVNAPATQLPPAIELKGADARHVYLPFAFDNQDLWNQSLKQNDLRRATLSLWLSLGDEPPQPLEIPLVHEWQVGDHYSCRPRHPPRGADAPGTTQ